MKNIIKKIASVVFVLGLLVTGGNTASAALTPSIVSATVSSVTQTSATFNGSVNPNGSNANAWFEMPGSGPLGSQPIGNSNIAISLQPYTATGLTPGTSYTFRVVGENTIGATHSSWISFTTLPAQQNTTVNLTASHNFIFAGQDATLSWTVTGWTGLCTATSFPGSSQWSGSKSWNGNPVTVMPASTTTYTLTCNGKSDSVTVNVTPVQQDPPPTVSLNANPSTITQGQSSNLTWSVQNAFSCIASGGWSGNKNASNGLTPVSPSNTTTYTLTCTGPGGTGSATTQVNVTPVQQNAPVVTLTANPQSVSYNGSTLLSWTVSNATSCVANSNPATNWTGNKNTNGGTQTISNLTSNTFFNIFCTGPGGSDSATVTVAVGSQPVSLPTVNLTANPTSVTSGGSTLLSWTSTNATLCNATSSNTQWTGSKATSGNTQVSNLTTTTTFSITCTNTSGSATDSVAIGVTSAPVNNPLVTTNSATGVNNSSATLNGLVNANGGSNVSAWFEWGTNSNLSNQTPENNYGSTSGTNFNYFLGGLSQNTTYYFRAVARGSSGQLVYGSTLNFNTTNVCIDCNTNTSRPNVTTYSPTNVTTNGALLNGFVDPNGLSATRWFEYGTSFSSLFNSTTRLNQGTNPSNFNEQILGLSAGTTYYYRAAAQNSNGTSYGNVIAFTTTVNTVINPCSTGSCAPTVATTLATNIGFRSARLNGVAFINGNVASQGYFEWGTTTGLGNITPAINLGNAQSIPMFSSLFTLSPSTTYYFRAVATNQYGTARGNIASFRTGSIVINTPNTPNTPNPSLAYRETTLVTNTNTVNTTGGYGISRPSLVFLTINSNQEVVNIGNTADYIVNYKNVSGEALNNVVLTVSMPNELKFISASSGNYSAVNNSVIVNIGNLNPQQEGSMVVTAQVTSIPETGIVLVTTAHVVYTIANTNLQEEVFAYSKNTVNNNGLVAGAAIFSGGFLPNTLMGWLLLLFLILLILFAAKMAYNNSSPRIVTVAPTNNDIN